MTFKYATPWNIWLFLFSAAVVIFAVLSPKMGPRTYRIANRVLFWLFVASTIFYAFVSIVALEILGKGVGALGRLAFTASIGSPLVMLLCLISVRWACLAMWTLFLVVHSYYFTINWPSGYGIIMAISFDWPLWTTALFLSVLTIRDTQQPRAGPLPTPIARSNSQV